MKTSVDVVVGCSVNPSIVWTGVLNSGPGEKIAGDYCIEPSGTSLDVALAVQRAGYSAHLVGAVGPHSDPFNGYLAYAVNKLGVSATLLELREKNALAHVEPEYCRALSAKPPILAFDPNHVRDQVRSVSATVRVATGVMPDDNELELARILLGNSAEVRVLNPRKALIGDMSRMQLALANANWLICNQDEANAYAWRHKPGGLIGLVGEGVLDVLVVTGDERGAELWTRDEGNIQVEAFHAGVPVHTVGAGDCFLGYLIAGWLDKLSWTDSLRLAAVAAGIKTTMPGTTSSPTRAVVEARLHEFPEHSNICRR